MTLHIKCTSDKTSVSIAMGTCFFTFTTFKYMVGGHSHYSLVYKSNEELGSSILFK